MNERDLKKFKDLQEHIESIDDGEHAEQIFLVIKNWLLKEKNYLELMVPQPLFNKLYEYAFLNGKKYPVSYSVLNEKGQINGVKNSFKIPQKKWSNIFNFLLNIIEQIIVYEADIQCPQCQKYGLGTYENKRTRKIIFECSQCGYAMYKDGQAYTELNRLSPAETETLIKESVLN